MSAFAEFTDRLRGSTLTPLVLFRRSLRTTRVPAMLGASYWVLLSLATSSGAVRS